MRSFCIAKELRTSKYLMFVKRCLFSSTRKQKSELCDCDEEMRWMQKSGEKKYLFQYLHTTIAMIIVRFFPCWDQLRVWSKFCIIFFSSQTRLCWLLFIAIVILFRLSIALRLFFIYFLYFFSFLFVWSCYFICFCVFSNAILRANLIRSVALAPLGLAAQNVHLHHLIDTIYIKSLVSCLSRARARYRGNKMGYRT